MSNFNLIKFVGAPEPNRTWHHKNLIIKFNYCMELLITVSAYLMHGYQFIFKINMM